MNKLNKLVTTTDLIPWSQYGGFFLMTLAVAFGLWSGANGRLQQDLFTVLLFLILGSSIVERAQCLKQVLRLRKQIQATAKAAGTDACASVPASVLEALREGNRAEATKRYCQATGTIPPEAGAIIDDVIYYLQHP